MFRRIRASRLGAASAVLTGSVLLGLASPATAAADEASEAAAPTVTWSVSPADPAGPDGRAWAELELDPGSNTLDHLAVRNLGDEAVTFQLDAADGYFTPTGRFTMLPSDRASRDAGLWITVADSVTVGAGETSVVPFTVAVPADAEPGDHAAGIAASLLSSKGDGESSVGVESRVGFRVMTRVTGEVAPALSLQDVHAQYQVSWNPFAPGRLVLSGTAVNDGNVRLHVSGSAGTATGRSAFDQSTDGTEQELLPGDRRSLTATVSGVWPLVAVGADLSLDARVIAPDGTSTALSPVATSIIVAAMPWPQLLVLLGVALIVLAAFGNRRRSRRRLAKLLDEARAEGRRAAAVPPALPIHQ